MAFATIDVTKGITGTIPVANGGTGLASGTAGQFLKFTGTTTLASAASGGITEADQWRMTSDHSFSGTYFITSNWERDDTNFTKIGTGLTESSGVFTFPSTGMYHIQTNFLYQPSGNDVTYAGGEIYTTPDNGTYTADTEGYQYIYNGMSGSTEHATTTISTIFDVTDVSTHKIKIRATISNTGLLKGSTTINKTYITVVRLGDT